MTLAAPATVRRPAATRYPRAAPWTAVAWLIAGTAWLMVLGAVAALVATAMKPAEVANWVMDLVTATVYGIVVVMMLPRSRHPVVWLLALTALGCGAAGLATAYLALPGGPPGQDLAFYAQYWAWPPGVYATVVVIPLLVVPGVRRRWPVVALAAVLITLTTLPDMTAVVPGLPHNALGIDVAWWQSVRRALGMWPHWAVALLGAAEWLWLASLVRRTRGPRRRGLTWLLAGHTAMVATFATFAASLAPLPDGWAAAATEASGTLLLLAQLFLPAALLVLVLGQQLWGVDARINRTVVWAMMTVTIALSYLLLVGLTTWLMPHKSEIALALGVGLVGLGSAPLRQLVQRRVDDLVYGTGTDPAQLLSTTERRGEHDVDGLAAALRRSLRLADVHILTEQPGSEPRDPVVRDGDVTITLRSRGRRVGLLVATPRPGERLDQRTTRTLTEVAGLVGMTIDLTQSVDALTAARRRMTSIRHEERRTLRRDLHDGLGPALAGIRLGLLAARGLQRRDPRAADEMLDALEHELSNQGEEVRRLSRSLVPLALDEGDLASALTSLASRFESDELEVRVSVPSDVDLEPSVQLAIYQMASEALLNAQRHARAGRCDIVLRRRADAGTLFIVSDNGTGIGEGALEGVGLRSMRERAEELGGVLQITSPSPGSGTRMELRLPPGHA